MDPMDYTMDDGHGQPAHIPNTSHCQRPPHQSPISTNFPSASRDAHHYDPVHNTESWYGNGNSPQSRPDPPYVASLSASSQWTTPTSYGWQGLGGAHGGSQGLDAAYQDPPRFTGIHSPWGEQRGFEPHPTSFGFIPGMYSVGPSSERDNSARSSIAVPTMPQGLRRFPPIPPPSTDYLGRTQNEAAMALNAQIRVGELFRAGPGVAAAVLPSNPLQMPGLHDLRHNLDNRRRDNPDYDSEDDDDPGMYSTHPYRADLIYNNLEDERRMAAARGAVLATGKSVPSKEFVTSLEKLDSTKDLPEDDRTCMICYNEFGVQNPDGIAEQPIRLPKCKHVFGDKCIKKWFEDSDSCPYCRDKLPSEQVPRKHPTYEHFYAAAHSRRAHMTAAAAAESARARPVYPTRAPDGRSLESGPPGDYSRNSSLEEYHYLARGGDGWPSNSSPNRSRETENRRRQARGRAGHGRPTSVGSARLVAPGPANPPNVQTRAHLQSIAPNTLNLVATTAPRRSITPGLTRQHSTGSAPIMTTPPRSRLSEASSPSSSEEASPPVAVGSGLSTGDRYSPPGGSRSYRDWNIWTGAHRNHFNASDQGHLTGRFATGVYGNSGQAGPDRSHGSDYPQRHVSFDSEGLGNRWSR